MAQSKTLFTLPVANQSQSRLLTLPSELLNTILRYLIVASDSLGFRPGNYGYVGLYDLSAQILSTCQHIRAIGIPLLYQGNTAKIIFHMYDTFSSEYELFALWMIHSGSSGQHLGCEQVSMKRSLSRELMSSACGISPNVAAFSALRRFQNFHVTLRFNNLTDLHTVCVVLKDVLQGKEVTFELKPSSRRRIPLSYAGPCIDMSASDISLKHALRALTGSQAHAISFQFAANKDPCHHNKRNIAYRHYCTRCDKSNLPRRTPDRRFHSLAQDLVRTKAVTDRMPEF